MKPIFTDFFFLSVYTFVYEYHVMASCKRTTFYFHHKNLEDTLDPHMRITGGFIDLSTQPLHFCSWNHGKALKIAVGIAAQKKMRSISMHYGTSIIAIFWDHNWTIMREPQFQANFPAKCMNCSCSSIWNKYTTFS